MMMGSAEAARLKLRTALRETLIADPVCRWGSPDLRRGRMSL
jgi:hypothetical protein